MKNIFLLNVIPELNWLMQFIFTILFVLIFNFFIKWGLKTLNKHFDKQQNSWKSSFTLALYTPLSCFIWTFAILHSLFLLIPSYFPESFYHQILSIASIFFITWFALRWKNTLAAISMRKVKTHELHIDLSLIDMLDKIGTVVVIFLAILSLLEITGNNLNTLIAFGGIGGLAIAFASQQMISNYFSGFMLYITRPFTVGDWIKLPEYKELEGTVEQIGWYMTRIRAFDKRPVYIPNATFGKALIETPSRMSHRQIKQELNIRYQDLASVESLIQSIKSILKSQPGIDLHEDISVYLNCLTTTSLNLIITAYTASIDKREFYKTRQEALLKIAKVLAEKGIKFTDSTTIIEIPKGIKIIEENRDIV